MHVVLLAFGPHGWSLILFCCVCTVSGMIIGTVGAGGVLLTPVLSLLSVPIDVAGAAAVAAFCIVGVTSIVSNRSDIRIHARRIAIMWPAIVPGAIVGAFLFPMLPPLAIQIEVAAITIVCGTRILIKDASCVPPMTQRRQLLHPGELHSTSEDPSLIAAPSPSASSSSEAPPAAAAADDDGAAVAELPPSITTTTSSSTAAPPAASSASSSRLVWPALGPLIGLLSLLTATGGPMIALPFFFRFNQHWPELSPRELLVIANSLMVPVGLCAGLVAVTSHTYDLALSGLIALFVSLGIPIGSHLARRLKPIVLRRLVALVLIGTGLSAIIKAML